MGVVAPAACSLDLPFIFPTLCNTQTRLLGCKKACFRWQSLPQKLVRWTNMWVSLVFVGGPLFSLGSSLPSSQLVPATSVSFHTLCPEHSPLALFPSFLPSPPLPSLPSPPLPPLPSLPQHPSPQTVGLLAKRSPPWLAATLALLRLGRPFAWMGAELPKAKRPAELRRNEEPGWAKPRNRARGEVVSWQLAFFFGGEGVWGGGRVFFG